MTILIVDDEPSIVEVLSILLEEEGYQVMTATNGQEALARLAAKAPDLVLCDMMMPLLDGRGLCHAMQRDPQYRSIPIVMMSAQQYFQGDERCNYAAFIHKPFDFSHLIATVSRFASENGRK